MKPFIPSTKVKDTRTWARITAAIADALRAEAEDNNIARVAALREARNGLDEMLATSLNRDFLAADEQYLQSSIDYLWKDASS